MNTYGVLDRNDCHTDVSNTLRGAKCYATRHGYSTVSVRYGCGYDVSPLAFRANGRWHNWNPTTEEIVASNIQRANENHRKVYGA